MAKAKTNRLDNSADGRAAILARPYARVLTPDTEVGGYTAEILEFPGCYAEGDTADEALENLDRAADGWIAAALEMGQSIPSPRAERPYRGKVALRIPPSLHQKAARAAEMEGVSLNQFIVTALAETVGARCASTRGPKAILGLYHKASGSPWGLAISPSWAESLWPHLTGSCHVHSTGELRVIDKLHWQFGFRVADSGETVEDRSPFWTELAETAKG